MIRTDSRKIEKGDTFVALPGISSNGSQYIEKAITAGAARVVCEAGEYQVETIHTADPRAWLENALVENYGSIIAEMTLIALTGTNGKTTTCYLIAQALNRMGRPCGYIGTIGFYLGEKVRDLPNTSVDICDLYELLLEAHEKGYNTVALEASSQGLAMGRLNTLSFDIAVFTNLTEDHLDYHKTMEGYALAKQQLFRQLKLKGAALVNADDPNKDYFWLNDNRNFSYGLLDGDIRALSYAFEKGTDLEFCLPSDDSSASKLSENVSYSSAEKKHEKSYNTHTSLIGGYNVYNTMAVVGVMYLLGYTGEQIAAGIQDLQAPDGRCDVISYKGANIVIDYAHTPDAVVKIIDTAKEFTSGKTYVVFGCTGDREREKRPVMTQIVLNNCDYAIITDDDPHTEPEQQIIDDMLEGNTNNNYEICLDRKEAIQKGMKLLSEGDSLLILGKGHENFIVMDGYKIAHNDREEVLLKIVNEK